MALIRRQQKEKGLHRRKTNVTIQEYKEFPRGGHVPDSPTHCPWRKQFEKSGKFWTETYFCGYICDDAVTCGAYKKYQQELRKERRR